MKETYEMPGLGYEPLTPSPGSRSQSRSLDKQMIRVKVAEPKLQTPATLLTSIHNTNQFLRICMLMKSFLESIVCVRDKGNQEKMKKP